eukprot:2828304-Pleurochrysis_carterae.AAC.3
MSLAREASDDGYQFVEIGIDVSQNGNVITGSECMQCRLRRCKGCLKSFEWYSTEAYETPNHHFANVSQNQGLRSCDPFTDRAAAGSG